MPTIEELQKLADTGRLDFEAGKYDSAAAIFEQAAGGYAALNDLPNSAEMKNNMSVAFLKAGKAQEALDAVSGTDEVFANIRDLKRQGIAVGNLGSALEALKRNDEALVAFERSAQIFADAGEGDMRSTVLKSAAAIKLKSGRIAESAFKMIGSLEAKDKPSIFERILKFFLRFLQR